MPTIMDSMMITVVAAVAGSERMMAKVSNRMTPNISGTSAAMSAMPVSAKALFSMDTPVR